MQVYFTSPTLGRIYGVVTTEDGKIYYFKGETVLIGVTLSKSETGWMCLKESWLHDYQIAEVGLQIDICEKKLYL